MTLLNVSKFSQDFMWGGREFQSFGPKDLMPLLPKLTWLTLGILRLSQYWLRTIVLVTLNLKISFINGGFIEFILL